MASQLPLQTNPLCQNVKTNFFFVHPESIPPDLLLFDIPLTRQTIDSFLTKISKMNPTSWINPSWKKAGQCCVVLFVHLGRMMIRLWNRLIRKKNEAGRVRVCGPTTGRYWLSSITKWIFSCYDGGGFLSGRCRNRGNGARREHRRPISCKKMKVTSRVFPPLRSSLGHSKPVSLVRLESTISAVLGFSFSFF